MSVCLKCKFIHFYHTRMDDTNTTAAPVAAPEETAAPAPEAAAPEAPAAPVQE